MLYLMKTAIIGAGAIGSLFGSLLKASGYSPVLYDTDSKKTEYINKNGIKLIYPKKEKQIHIFPEATDNIEEIKGFDYYVFCVKSYSTKAAAEKVSSVKSEQSIALSIQNGTGNEYIIANYFSKDFTAAGVTSEGASFISPASVIYGGKGKTLISIIKENPDNSKLKSLIKIFNRSGIETDITKNYRHDIWKKLIINAAINPVTAVLGFKNKAVSESPYLGKLTEMIIKDAVKGARAAGIKIDYNEIRETVFSTAEKTGENYSSMLQDIKNKRKTEIDYISGAIADYTENNGADISVSRIMQNIINALENRYFT